MSQNWAQTTFGSPYGNFGGGGTPEPWWRDALDYRRSMWRQTPDAQYPDGYLGTYRGRREDKILDKTKNRQTQRSYQRGVHKGERIDPGDYVWPMEWHPQLGLMAEAAGVRQAPATVIPGRISPITAPRGVGGLADMSSRQVLDPHRVEQLRRLSPSWR